MSCRPIIGCYRVSDLPRPETPSMQLVCHRCREWVWLSHITVATVKKNHGGMDAVEIYCLQCAKPELEQLQRGDAKLGGLSNEQMDDLEKRAGRPLSKERLEADAKRLGPDLIPRDKK